MGRIRSGALALLVVVAAGSVATASAAADSGSVDAYVTNQGDGTVTPVDMQTDLAGTPITVGSAPAAAALGPDGTIYVANKGSDSVSKISSSSDTVTATVNLPAGSQPDAIAVVPSGADRGTAYVADAGTGKVSVIPSGASAATAEITVGDDPTAIAITPNGELAYVLHSGNEPVTPIIITEGNRVGPSIPTSELPASPVALAINPDGTTGYVVSAAGGDVVPFAIPTDKPGSAINTMQGPWAMALSSDGGTGYVVASGGGQANTYGLSIVNLANDQSSDVSLTSDPTAVALSPDGTAAYVTETNGSSSAGSLTPFALSSGSSAVPGSPITVGTDPSSMVVTPFTPDTVGGSGNGYNLGELGGGDSGDGVGGSTPVAIRPARLKLGNELLTLTATASPNTAGTGSTTASPCLSPSAKLAVRLTSSRLRRGATIRFAKVTVAVDGHRRLVRTRPALTLSVGLVKSGTHHFTVTLTGRERTTVTVRRHGKRVHVTRWVKFTRTLRVSLRTC